jgi:hypothetical protein
MGLGLKLGAILDYPELSWTATGIKLHHHLGRKWAWHVILVLFPHLDLKTFPLHTFRKDLSSSNRVTVVQ